MAFPSRFGTESSGNFASSTSDSINHTVPSGSFQNTALLVLVSTGGDNSSPTEVRWGGSGGTLLTKLAENNTTWGASIWILPSPTAMASTVYAAFGASIRHNIIAINIQDVVQVTPLDTSGSNSTASGTSLSKSVTTTLDNDLLVALISIQQGYSGLTLDSGQTSVITVVDVVATTLDSNVSEKGLATAGSTSMGYTWTTAEPAALVVVALKYVAPTGGGGGAYKSNLLLMGVG